MTKPKVNDTFDTLLAAWCDAEEEEDGCTADGIENQRCWLHGLLVGDVSRASWSDFYMSGEADCKDLWVRTENWLDALAVNGQRLAEELVRATKKLDPSKPSPNPPKFSAGDVVVFRCPGSQPMRVFHCDAFTVSCRWMSTHREIQTQHFDVQDVAYAGDCHKCGGMQMHRYVFGTGNSALCHETWCEDYENGLEEKKQRG